MTHLPRWTKELQQTFGYGYGALSTQATEHSIKKIKQELCHSLRNADALGTVMKHMHQAHYGFDTTVRPVVTVTCSACGSVGHAKSNQKLCPMHPDNRPQALDLARLIHEECRLLELSAKYVAD